MSKFKKLNAIFVITLLLMATTSCLGPDTTHQAGEGFADSDSNLSPNSSSNPSDMVNINDALKGSEDISNIDSTGITTGATNLTPDFAEESNQQSEFYTTIDQNVVESYQAKWAANEPYNYEYTLIINTDDENAIIDVTCVNKVCTGTGGPKGSDITPLLGAGYLGTMLNAMIIMLEMTDAFMEMQGMGPAEMESITYSYRFNTIYGFVSRLYVDATEEVEALEMEIVNFKVN